MIRIARLTPDDWQLLMAVRLNALNDSPDSFSSTYEDERGKREIEDWCSFVAFDDGTPAGMAAVGNISGKYGLFSLWVAPRSRGKKIADKLIESAVTFARSNRRNSLFLGVADSNDSAIRLYERHGFRPTGVVSTLPEPRTHITEHERLLEFPVDNCPPNCA
jgi:ribosomal protein S18 acetylase RimI-like enzyme